MKNSYEMAEIVELGKAEHVILGTKIFALRGDAVLGPFFYTNIIWDIDETDE